MTSIMDLHLPPFHPILRAFPEMPDTDLDALTVDIERNGQRRPIALYEGCVWDGRARLEACKRLLIQPRYWLLRRGDPVLFLVARNSRFGEPHSPERRAALAHFKEMETSEARAASKKKREEWMVEARREFRWRVRHPEPCAVCGKHREMVHAHHSLPLNLQYDLGLFFANQEHDWLCPVHHQVVHTYISIYITCTKPGWILESIRDEKQDDWVKAGEVFQRGQALFRKFGGMNYDRAEWNDTYPHMVMPG